MNDLVSVINGMSPVQIEEKLNRAVALAQQQSIMGRRLGILVTRHSYYQFTVELHQDVAFGEIRERCIMHPARSTIRPHPNSV
ncbi:hypothetical protein [Arthrobacter sp. Cr_A7]|uniref:hypothetical protein n=1 Tax=Arthrobacter sp. Cr_A7 TaxID=3031017 RepID=UPI0023DC191A|nr:hypothetical protein [Arthrobacter sp. Cr_A7]MDF2050483.1 hypothetical protein [Arthrobacter sp. Cr_A7]